MQKVHKEPRDESYNKNIENWINAVTIKVAITHIHENRFRNAEILQDVKWTRE